MARDVQFYVNRALERFNVGLDCEARRKEALGDVNSAYEMLRRVLMDAALALRVEVLEPYAHYEMPPAVESMYWGLPGYPHQWKPKHAELVRAALGGGFDALISDIERLVELRAEIKAAPVNPAPVKEMNPYEVKARAKIADVMAKRQADYVDALELGEIFGGLPVSVNSHVVHGHKGAIFYRNFYYLAGKFMALNVIIAAAQELERRKESASA